MGCSRPFRASLCGRPGPVGRKVDDETPAGVGMRAGMLMIRVRRLAERAVRREVAPAADQGSERQTPGGIPDARRWRMLDWALIR